MLCKFVYAPKEDMHTAIRELEKIPRPSIMIPFREMAATFNMLRSNDLIWSFVINNYLLGRSPAAFDLLYWNNGSTRMPSVMHRYYLNI